MAFLSTGRCSERACAPSSLATTGRGSRRGNSTRRSVDGLGGSAQRTTSGSGRRGSLAILLLTLGLVLALAAPAGAALDSRGTDFWLTFPQNLSTPTLTLFIAADTATTGTVSIPGLAFTQAFTVTPGAVTSVSIPAGAQLDTSDAVTNRGIHVTSANAVTVYGLNRIPFTTDAYLGLPTASLGTSYINLGYENTGVVNGTEFGIVATADGTTVTITPSVTTGGHPAGVAYTVAMNQGQTYQLKNSESSTADLSGSILSSNKPIGLFGGHECANIPKGFVACDHVVEELPPTTEWGKKFVNEPLATRTGGDTFRIMASTDNTTVTINGGAPVVLNRAQIAEQVITGASVIAADKPILVMQYSNSTTFDNVTSDPFQLMAIPSEQFLASYTVSTPASGFAINDINVVAPTADVGAVKLDGVAIPVGSFTPIGASGFSGAHLPVSLGSHTLNGPLPFGVSVYGFASFDSYGYPGGANFAPVATVAHVTLAPKTQTAPVATSGCVTATVTDSNAAAVVGIRVDFAVTGANPSTGFVFTDVGGHAQYCYTGANAGDDAITGTVGSLSDTATKTWTTTTATHDTQLAYTGPGTGDYDDPVTLSARLTDKTSPGPVTGQPVTFKLNGSESCTSTTNASGDASCSITPGEAAGTYPLTVTFGGSPGFKTSSTSIAFKVTKEETQLVYTGDTHVANATTATLSGVLTEDGTNPISGRLVKFSLGSQTCSGTTSVAGKASCTVTTSQPSEATTASITASFAGDGFYLPAAAATTARLTYMTGRAFGLSAHAVLGLVGVTVLPTPDTGSISTSTAGATATPCVATVTGPVKANGLCANVTTTVGPGTSTATATVDNLGIVGLPQVPAITASAVAAHSTSTCSGASGQATFASLTIGSANYVKYNPAPNTTIVLALGVGTIVLNEQLPVAGADHGTTVNAIHIRVPSLATDVVVASARSDIHNCT